MSDFYLTLPSNSNVDMYPNNTLTHYTVKFNQRLPIDDTFEIGLVECHFPYRLESQIETSVEDTLSLTRREGDEDRTVIIPMKKTFWPNRIALIEAINHIISTFAQERKITHTVPSLKFFGDNELKIVDNTRIGLRLSTSLDRKLWNSEIDYIHVYSDIVEPSFVGDSRVRLLRIVDVSCPKGKVCSVIYENPIYLKVTTKEPQTIEINLRTSLGNFIPIKGDGVTIVVLHARKRLH